MTSSEKKDEWKFTTKRFVAYIDIMGFKDMVARQSHSNIYKMMKKIELTKNVIEKLDWVNPTRKSMNNLIRTTNYSDSIMIYSKDSSPEAKHSFICSVAALTDSLLVAEIPHKGAFAFGTMTLDTTNSIFFGQPLIDAYLLQEEIYFYGIVGHSSAEKELSKHIGKTFIHKFPCYFKNGISNHTIICPINTFPFETNKKEHRKIFQSVGKLRYKTSGSLRKYIDNTESYLSQISKEIQ